MDLENFRANLLGSKRREMEAWLYRFLGAAVGLTLQELARKDPGPSGALPWKSELLE